MLNIEFLRSLPKAVYRATPDGHYGLNKQDYTHFTSPIRRYSDLVVHRILEGHIAYDRDNQKQPQNKTLRKCRLEEISQHISLTERNSIDAERESVKIKLMEFFERELKKKPKSNFRAVVMDIARSGVFVELKDSGAFGCFLVVTIARKGLGILTHQVQLSFWLASKSKWEMKSM